MGNSFNKDKLKVQSRMGAGRLKAKGTKLENTLVRTKREIAILVQSGKTPKARIKVESVIRDENVISTYDLLENMCELIHQRAMYIASEKECPPDLLECICTVMYAAPRTDVKELNELGMLFSAKYGKSFIERHKENRSGYVSKRVVHGLSTQPPPFDKVLEKMRSICEHHDIVFDETELNVEAAESSTRSEQHGPLDQEKVNDCVRFLMDPSTFDMSEEQRLDLCRTNGASPAEASAALHIATRQIAEQQNPRPQENPQQYAPPPAHPVPQYIQPIPANQKPMAYPANNNENMVTFPTRPFGMQWTETSDQRNLYVSKVDIGGQAHQLNVREGSLIVAVNNQRVENMGAAQVFQICKSTPLPFTLTFRALTNSNPEPQPQVFNPPPPSYTTIQHIEPAQPAQPMTFAPPPSDVNVFDLPSVPGSGGETGHAAFDLPDVPGGNSSNTTTNSSAPKQEENPDYADLEARFAALKGGLN